MNQGNHGYRQKNDIPLAFGIFGVFIGLFSMCFSLIPCIGIEAVVPAVLALILSIVSMITAKQQGQKALLAVVGIVISAIAIGIIVFQLTLLLGLGNAAIKSAKESLEERALQDSLRRLDSLRSDTLDVTVPFGQDTLESDSIVITPVE
ncbi:MAG: hypothetical protein AAFX87_12550 [Bacteroidota bacterium]